MITIATIWAWILCSSICLAIKPPAVYYLFPDCGVTIDLTDLETIRLKLAGGKVPSEMKCYRLLTTTKSGRRLQLQFKDMNIEWSDGCSKDYLELRDGKSSASPYVKGFEGNLCGNTVNKTAHSTTGSDLYVLFRSGKESLSRGFELVITQFHTLAIQPASSNSTLGKLTSACEKGEFRCRNGHCISDKLLCNGYNPCGDNSDCERCEHCEHSDTGESVKKTDIIVVAVCGSIAVAIGFASLGFICYRRSRRNRLNYQSFG